MKSLTIFLVAAAAATMIACSPPSGSGGFIIDPYDTDHDGSAARPQALQVNEEFSGKVGSSAEDVEKPDDNYGYRSYYEVPHLTVDTIVVKIKGSTLPHFGTNDLDYYLA